MLLYILSAALPTVAVADGMAPAVLIVLWWKRSLRQQRKSPLVRDLLRGPGHSLRQQIEESELHVEIGLALILLTPLLVYAVRVSQSYFGKQPEMPARILTSVMSCIIAVAAFGNAILRSLRTFRNYVLGLDGELAVGEELNQLMFDGCRVFHDVPIQYGNIDHVVVSPSGVYSVNTKMRGKPTAMIGAAEVVIDHERNLMAFPDGAFPIPTQKLQIEAKCLSELPTNAIGEPVEVEPMLALPGWFIKERIGRSPVFVFNPSKPHRFFLQDRQRLSQQLMQRIAHQIENLCRDIKPSYREEKAWIAKK